MGRRLPTVVLLVVLVRVGRQAKVPQLCAVLLVIWVMQVCLVVNPYNCVCGLADALSRNDTETLTAFFSEHTARPALALVHVYLSSGVYLATVFAAGVPPFHYHNHAYRVTAQERGLAVYLDVSGSVNQHR